MYFSWQLGEGEPSMEKALIGHVDIMKEIGTPMQYINKYLDETSTQSHII